MGYPRVIRHEIVWGRGPTPTIEEKGYILLCDVRQPPREKVLSGDPVRAVQISPLFKVCILFKPPRIQLIKGNWDILGEVGLF